MTFSLLHSMASAQEDQPTMLSTIIDFVSARLDRGEKTIGIFIDLAKAFDTVSVAILLEKMERQRSGSQVICQLFGRSLPGRKS